MQIHLQIQVQDQYISVPVYFQFNITCLGIGQKGDAWRR